MVRRIEKNLYCVEYVVGVWKHRYEYYVLANNALQALEIANKAVREDLPGEQRKMIEVKWIDGIVYTHPQNKL